MKRAGARTAGLRLFLLFFTLLLLCGGSARPEAWSQTIARLAAILAGGIALLIAPPGRPGIARPILLLLGAITLLIALQLVPLPPSVWSHLGGRGLLAAAEQAAGLPPAWRPLTMTPDLTLNALLATLPAWATAVLIAAIPNDRLPGLVPILIGGLVAGALLGLAQAGTGAPWLYTYAITNPGVATGWFANRNHDALALGLLLPLAAAWIALQAARRGRVRPIMLAAAAAWALLAIGSVMATGSRAGLALLPLALFLALLLLQRSVGLRRILPHRRIALAAGAIAFFLLALVPLALQSEGAKRMGTLRVADDGRIILLRPLLAMARAYLPWGTGFGSFATAFRIDEPFANLDLAWLNHAHDDLLEIGIEGGIAAWVIAAIALVWLARSILRLWRGGRDRPAGLTALGWLGASWAVLLLLASLVDYPLRTPICMSLFVLAAALLDRAASHVTDESSKSVKKDQNIP